MNELKADEESVVDLERVKARSISEVSESERLEKAAEEIGGMKELRPKAWEQMDETSREWCLRHVGERLSAAYECPAPPFIGSQMPEVDGGVLLGEHSDPEYRMRVNRELLGENSPDQALETYCHEFRHSYQHEMATRYNSAFRHLCHDEVMAARWAENLKPGNYISFEEDPERYAAQPVEADARDFADRLRNEVQQKR